MWPRVPLLARTRPNGGAGSFGRAHPPGQFRVRASSGTRIGVHYEQGHPCLLTPRALSRNWHTSIRGTRALADVHAAIAYYLRHREQVRAYLSRRKEQAEALRAKIEAERPRPSHEELLARRRAAENENAAATIMGEPIKPG